MTDFPFPEVKGIDVKNPVVRETLIRVAERLEEEAREYITFGNNPREQLIPRERAYGANAALQKTADFIRRQADSGTGIKVLPIQRQRE